METFLNIPRLKQDRHKNAIPNLDSEAYSVFFAFSRELLSAVLSVVACLSAVALAKVEAKTEVLTKADHRGSFVMKELSILQD